MIARTTFFPDQPDVRPYKLTDEERKEIKRRWVYVLRKAFVYQWMSNAATLLRLTVPAGFRSDGASIPRFLWSLIGLLPDGLIRAAALVHDFIYRHNGRMPDKPECAIQVSADGGTTWRDVKGFTFERKQGDDLFRRIMLDSGMNKAMANMAHRGVRWFARRWGPEDIPEKSALDAVWAPGSPPPPPEGPEARLDGPESV